MAKQQVEKLFTADAVVQLWHLDSEQHVERLVGPPAVQLPAPYRGRRALRWTSSQLQRALRQFVAGDAEAA